VQLSMAGYSSYGRQLTAQPDPHGESYGGSKKAGYFPRDPAAETWSVPASKNRGLSVPPGFRNEIGQTPSAAALRVDRQLHLDTKAYFRWTSWKAKYFALWGVIVPVGIYMAITNEMVRTERLTALLRSRLTLSCVGHVVLQENKDIKEGNRFKRAMGFRSW
jgi:hypothetical protein